MSAHSLSISYHLYDSRGKVSPSLSLSLSIYIYLLILPIDSPSYRNVAV